MMMHHAKRLLNSRPGWPVKISDSECSVVSGFSEVTYNIVACSAVITWWFWAHRFGQTSLVHAHVITIMSVMIIMIMMGDQLPAGQVAHMLMFKRHSHTTLDELASHGKCYVALFT